jgi:hypothetical protein
LRCHAPKQEQNRETKYVVQSSFVWPEDKDGNIIKPSWWVDEEKDIAGVFTPRAAQGSQRERQSIED